MMTSIDVMAAHNPFVYGEIVPLEAFADRVIELDRLVTDLAEGQKAVSYTHLTLPTIYSV